MTFCDCFRPFAPRNKPPSSPFSYFLFTFLSCFSYCFMLSPFVFLGFYTVGYIYSCTVDPSTVSKKKNTVPTSFPASLALRTPRFRSHSTCAPRCNLPILSLLLRTRLAPFAPRHAPATAVVCLFWARPAVCQRISVPMLEACMH